MLIALTAITACGGPQTLTPGIYTYTLTATQETTSQTVGASQSQSTTFTLTVPSGIVTN
jgi:hypothetical protein